MHIQSQKYNEAIAVYQQAELLFKEAKDTSKEARAISLIGGVHFVQKQYDLAIEFYQKSKVLLQEAKDEFREQSVIKAIGDVYLQQKKYEQAIDAFQEVLIIAKKIKDLSIENLVLDELTRVHSALSNPQKTIEFAQQSIIASRQIKNQLLEGRALAFLAVSYASLNENQKAIEVGHQALVIAKEITNLEIKSVALDTLVIAYSGLSNPQKTIEFAQQSIMASRQTKNQFFEGRALAFLADSYASLNENQKAIELAQQALVIAKETTSLEVESLALDALTRAYSGLSNPQKAIEFAQQSIIASRQIKNQILEGRALAFLANAYASLSENQKAVETGQQALVIAKEIRNSNPESLSDIEHTAMFAIARAHKDLEEYDQAIKFAQQSLSVAQRSQNLVSEVFSLDLVGGIYGEMEGKDKEAEAAIQEGLAIAHKLLNYDLQIRLLITASTNSQLNDDYKEAIALAQEAFSLSQKHKTDGSDLAPALQLMDLYNDLGAYREMAILSQKISDSGRKTDNPIMLSVGLAFQSMAYFGEGKQQEAMTSSQQLLEITRGLKTDFSSKVFEAIGLALLSLGHGNSRDYDRALVLSRKGLLLAKKLKDSDAESMYLELEGSIYHKNSQFKQAIESYRAALILDEESSSAKAGLARIYRDINMPITAITYYKQAINEIEKKRKSIRNLSLDLQASFLQTLEGFDGVKSIDSYRELADLLLSQGRILEAQQVLELLKTQEIQDFTRSEKGATNPQLKFAAQEGQIGDKSDSLIAFGLKVDECQQKKCPALDQLLNQLDALTQQFDQQVQGIEKAYHDREVKDRTTLAPEDFLAQAEQIVEAQPGTVLIYPLVLENKTWLLWASKGVVVKSIEIPNIGQHRLGETVLKFRQLLQNPNSNPSEVKAVGEQLYNWLLKPLEAELKANQIQNLVFSLDRATRYIPMSALFDGEKYLVERYRVSTVLSAGYTDMTGRLPTGIQNTNILALGVSDAKAGFSALPNVPAELDAIVRQNNSDKQGVYPGRKLLNTAFDFPALRRYLGDYQIIHIATHGKFEPTNPENSFLLLGDGNPLEIRRIRTLQNLRNVYLVVLSACETALGGADRDGVEIAGISSYFLQKGKAKAVMASLWNVNDASTALIMQQFYKHLASGMTKAEALQHIQQDFIQGRLTSKDAPQRAGLAAVPVNPHRISGQLKEFSHPYYWAPFILIGNSL